MLKDLFVKLRIPNESAMMALGAKLSTKSLPTAIIFFYGQLGAGKTTLVRGILRGLGYEGHVKSPTYTLVEPYELPRCTIYHFDFYRIKEPQELEYMGIQDYFDNTAVCLVEWPEHGTGMLPPADLSCHLSLAGSGRDVKIVSHSGRGETILHRFEYE